MIFVCGEENDLYRAALGSGMQCSRSADIDAALEAEPAGGCVLVLSSTYPVASGSIGRSHLDAAAAKGLRLYVEYPESLEGVELGQPRRAQWERGVVATDYAAPGLPALSILALHGCWYRPVEALAAHLVLARVAGYDTAVYGIPDNAQPLLFEVPGREVLLATTNLSSFVTGRYAPLASWKTLWHRLLGWLTRYDTVPDLVVKPTVRVQSGPDEDLPPSAERDALDRSVRWFRESTLFSVDKKKGVIEGFESGIDHLGRQTRRTWARSDCIGEAALVFALDGAIGGSPDSRLLAEQILDYVWSAPDFLQEDPDSPVYGLVNWYERGPVFYGDDNARVILPTIASAHLLGDDRWTERTLRCLLANLRTTGPQGFRKRRLDWPQSFAGSLGWRHYYEADLVDFAPHYQAYLWAANLMGCALTGWSGFHERTLNAIRCAVEAYPDWKWTNGLTQELSRMLLPLAFLVRLEDTEEHRGWLRGIASELLQSMQPCGAIRERLGPAGSGGYPPPASNAAYGTSEASLIQRDGDPACDLLYTANYALLGLHEAAAATGEALFADAADRLADFLVRTQVRSETHPYLDGSWMRSFDYELWEYWGSSADLGWGAWSVESGWTNTWIAAVLALRQMRRSLWELADAAPYRDLLPALEEEMMHGPDAPSAEQPAQPRHGQTPGSE